jgi:hypothetical protein
LGAFVAAYRACFGCVTDEEPEFQQGALFLLASLRALGGAYAGADFVICVVGTLAPPLATMADTLGARVVAVAPLSETRPQANKLRFLALPELARYDYAVLLDCDTAIATSPEDMFGGTGMRARIAGGRSVPPSVLDNLFAEAGMAPPPPAYLTTVTAEPTPLYCNSGVVVMAGAIVGRFIDIWQRRQAWLLEHPELLPGCAGHAQQASLSLALAECGVAFEPLDLRFNFPAHRPRRSFFTPAVDVLDPVILHYNHPAEDWTLLPSLAAGANRAIDRVNAAWRETRARLQLPMAAE